MIWIPVAVTLCAALWVWLIWTRSGDGDFIAGIAALWDSLLPVGLVVLGWIVYLIVR